MAKNSNFDTFTKYNSSFDTMTLNDLNKFKNLTVKGLYESYSHHPYYTYFEDYDAQQNLHRNQAFPSEFDTSSFRSLSRYKMIRKPINLDSNEIKIIDELKDQFQNKKNSSIYHTTETHSTNNLSGIEQNNQLNLSQSQLGLNKFGLNQTGFSSQLGLNQLGLNRLSFNSQLNNNIVLRQLATKPFDYLNRPGSVMNLTIPYESDENYNNLMNETTKDTLKKNTDKSVHSLRDVAL